ncbi:MAG TPA: DUF2185 domain-containing protein, partial [Planctomycetes bacterium]|nr:DUF2185 domain-containing protein [Planctomycetota bacterium]
FWGPDATALAERFGAKELADGRFGWRDEPYKSVREHAPSVEGAVKEEKLRVRTDYRPHGHYHLLRAGLEASEEDCAVLELGEARVCGFGNRWGDGLFRVAQLRDAAGNLLRLRAEVGDEKSQRLSRQVALRSKTAFVSKLVADGCKVRFLYREEADNENDSGWRVFRGIESQDYVDDPSNCVLMPLGAIVDRDPELKKIYEAPPGSAFERGQDDEPFAFVDDFTPG